MPGQLRAVPFEAVAPEAPSLPLICSVVLHWRTPGLTSRCVESLARQDEAGGEHFCHSIIVVDNGSGDLRAQDVGGAELLPLLANRGYAGGKFIIGRMDKLENKVDRLQESVNQLGERVAKLINRVDELSGFVRALLPPHAA